MSPNSASLFSVEDDGSLSETPTSSQQKYTRGLPCSKSDCLVCNGPVSNLSQIREKLLTHHTSPEPHQPPPRQLVLELHSVFLHVLRENNLAELFYMFRDAIHQDHLEELTRVFERALLCKDSARLTCVANWRQTP